MVVGRALRGSNRTGATVAGEGGSRNPLFLTHSRSATSARITLAFVPDARQAASGPGSGTSSSIAPIRKQIGATERPRRVQRRVEHVAGRRLHVARDRRDAEEDRSEQVHRGDLPPLICGRQGPRRGRPLRTPARSPRGSRSIPRVRRPHHEVCAVRQRGASSASNVVTLNAMVPTSWIMVAHQSIRRPSMATPAPSCTCASADARIRADALHVLQVRGPGEEDRADEVGDGVRQFPDRVEYPGSEPTAKQADPIMNSTAIQRPSAPSRACGARATPTRRAGRRSAGSGRGSRTAPGRRRATAVRRPAGRRMRPTPPLSGGSPTRPCVDRLRLLGSRRSSCALEVGDQQVGQVVAEPVADDDPQRGQVGAVGRERVGRHQPAALAQRARRRRTR